MAECVALTGGRWTVPACDLVSWNLPSHGLSPRNLNDMAMTGRLDEGSRSMRGRAFALPRISHAMFLMRATVKCKEV